MSFETQTVMVTGAAGNLGKAVADAFAQRGARLLLIDRSADLLRKSFGDEGKARLFVPVDLLGCTGGGCGGSGQRPIRARGCPMQLGRWFPHG